MALTKKGWSRKLTCPTCGRERIVNESDLWVDGQDILITCPHPCCAETRVTGLVPEGARNKLIRTANTNEPVEV